MFYIIIKSEVFTFPIVFNFFFVVVSLRCLLHHILSLIVYAFREGREFVFISIVQFMMSANSRIRFGLQIVFVCFYITPSHYHLCAYFFWRHWTYKMPVRYNLSSVWVKLDIFFQLIIVQCVGLCVCGLSVSISYVMIEGIYMLCLIIIIKSEVWTITHCLGAGHETMVRAVCFFLYSYGIFKHTYILQISRKQLMFWLENLQNIMFPIIRYFCRSKFFIKRT